ncbi:MAG: glycosyltransferase family 39 protein [Burkholderiaceae bacterium]|nr:MAG: glycosyltransferase family 39 protein [Burkholderiaceae bacterium]
MPRLLLFGLLLLYILPGLLGRDPWRTDDATGFGLMWTMAQGTLSDWLMPNVVGIPLPSEGPLFFWLGGLSIKLFGPVLGAVVASRIPTALAVYALCWALWYAAFALARRPEAQPHDPIGGASPEAVAYGRMVADAAMLILLATLGLVGRLHETTAEVGAIAWVALGLYSLATTLRRPLKGGALFGLSLAGALLTRGVVVALPLFFAALLAFTLCRPLRFNLKPFASLAVSLTVPLLMIWPLLLWQNGTAGQAYLQQWWDWNLDQFGLNPAAWRSMGRTVLWFAWPAWPIALWALWTLRIPAPNGRGTGLSGYSPQFALPLSLTIAFVLLALGMREGSDSYLMPLLPGLAILAAFGLTRLKRGAINAIDWFAVMVFSTLCIAAWFYWIAAISGYPARAAARIATLAPGFKPVLVWTELLLALSITIAWGWLIHWRISRRPKVLWRSVVLSSGGLVLAWALLTTLWLPWLNHTRTYRDVAQQIRAALPADYRCVETRHLGLAQRATLAFYANLRFAQTDTEKQQSCDILLLQDSVADLRDARLPDERWHLLWQGRRAANRDERFRLYEREISP